MKTKKNYQYIMENKDNFPFNKKNLNGWDYSDFKTLKNLNVYASEIFQKQESRQYQYEIPKNISERFKSFRNKNLNKIIMGNMHIPHNNGMRLVDSDVVSLVTEEQADYNYYSKSYGHPKIWKTAVISLPFVSFFAIAKRLRVIDGIINIAIISSKKIGDLELLKTKSLKRTRSSIDAVILYIASIDGVSYHSSISIRDAVKKLKKKIRKIDLQNCVNLDLNTMISRSDYSAITGACPIGVSQFCLKNEIGSKISIKNLLPMLEGHFGYSKLFNAVSAKIAS